MDWPAFLDAQGIAYVERGKNVSRGNIAINCPFCAGADPSEHLNISLHDRGWYCLRNRGHSGRSDARLLQALLNCTYEHALSIAQGGSVLPDNWYARVMQMVNMPTELALAKPLVWPKEFRKLDLHSVLARPYVAYLRGRRYTDNQIDRMQERFDISYCRKGAFHGRIIFPVYFEDRLVTWTGRTISRNVDLRYKTLTADPDKAFEEGTQCALGPVSNYLLWWDDIIDCDADTIVLCEGPFDALRIMHLGWTEGIVATCFFTAQPGPMQVELLHELLPRYKRRFLLLDEGTWATTMQVTDSLAALRVQPLHLPSGTKDPDLLTLAGMRQVIH